MTAPLLRLDPATAAAMRTILTGSAHHWDTPGDMAQALDPTTVQTPALRLIDTQLAQLTDTTDGRLIVSMPPQEGKSQRCSRRFPLWALTHNPDTRIAIASYAHSVARRWGRVIRDDIAAHPKLGLTVRPDLSAQHEWQLAGHEGGIYATGVGGALTGRAVDLLIIDDPIKDREQADSKVYRERVWDWWTDVASTRLAPGAPVVLILTRWHEDDLAGRLLASDDADRWSVINIPAQADSSDDPLGRTPGQWLQSARGRTTAQWEAIKRQAGSRTFASLYQGHPSPPGGTIFNREHWIIDARPAWQADDNQQRWVPSGVVFTSWDLTFKGGENTDWVVGQAWRRGHPAPPRPGTRPLEFHRNLPAHAAHGRTMATGHRPSRRGQSQRPRRPRRPRPHPARTHSSPTTRRKRSPRQRRPAPRRSRERSPARLRALDRRPHRRTRRLPQRHPRRPSRRPHPGDHVGRRHPPQTRHHPHRHRIGAHGP